MLNDKEPPDKRAEGLSVADLCNQFLAHKEQLRDNGELNPRTFRCYYDTCATVVEVLGRNRVVADLRPEDFRKLRAKLAQTRGIVSLRNEMQRVRSVFKFGFDDVLLETPIRFGQAFIKPKPDAVRRAREEHRAEHGDRMFSAGEIRQILAVATQPLKAMVLLAANTGFGQSDLTNLTVRAVDLDARWLDFGRPKTGVPRRIPMWPETIEAIREWLQIRPKAKDDADASLMFLTVRGARWSKVSEKAAVKDAIGQEFVKLLRKLGLKRPRVSFYGLRHGFETIAGETADQVAVDAIMGHVPKDMSAAYRERIGDDRLQHVVNYVRQWLFGKKDPDTTKQTTDNSDEAVDDATDDAVESQLTEQRPALRLYVG